MGTHVDKASRSQRKTESVFRLRSMMQPTSGQARNTMTCKSLVCERIPLVPSTGHSDLRVVYRNFKPFYSYSLRALRRSILDGTYTDLSSGTVLI